MLNLLTRGQGLSVGASCLVHVALIVGILSARGALDPCPACEWPPEVVTVSDAPSSPETIQKKPEPKRRRPRSEVAGDHWPCRGGGG
jgi:hypothetical protein